MKRALRSALLAAALGPGVARADGFVESAFQLPTLVSIGPEVAISQRALRDLVDAPSFRGGHLEVTFGLARQLAAGLSGSWNWMAQGFPSGSLQLPNGAITGRAYRRVQLADLRGTATWYLAKGPAQPYLGVGLGGGWHSTYVAVASVVRTSGGWHAAGEPRAGLLWTVRRGVAVNLQARYVFTNAQIGDVRDARWLALDVGIALY